MMTDSSEQTAPGETHITSIVVHARSDAVAQVSNLIRQVDGAEVHAASEMGKLIVTLETKTLHQVTEFLDDVSQFPGVANALLVYHHVEDSELLDDEIELDVSNIAQKNEATP